jgi:3-oxoacyl-[acyl-carrier protein] reductase
MESSMREKIILVTGAGRGIGRAIAHRFSAAEATVYVNDCNVAAAEQCVLEIAAAGRAAYPASGDVSDSEQVKEIFRAIGETHGRLDALINNAAVSRPRPFIETSDDDWRTVLDVNLSGVFYCSRAAFPLMQGGGRIINLSSVSAYTGKVSSENAAYVAAKAGVDGLTRALAREGAVYGITVNSVAPGIVATEIHASMSPARRAELPALVPLGRLASSEEIAEMVWFLASPAGNHITGQVIHVNGGMFFS